MEAIRTRYHMLGHTGSLKGREGGSPRTCLFTRRRTSCCCSHSTCGHRALLGKGLWGDVPPTPSQLRLQAEGQDGQADSQEPLAESRHEFYMFHSFVALHPAEQL